MIILEKQRYETRVCNGTATLRHKRNPCGAFGRTGLRPDPLDSLADPLDVIYLKHVIDDFFFFWFTFVPAPPVTDCSRDREQ